MFFRKDADNVQKGYLVEKKETKEEQVINLGPQVTEGENVFVV